MTPLAIAKQITMPPFGEDGAEVLETLHLLQLTALTPSKCLFLEPLTTGDESNCRPSSNSGPVCSRTKGGKLQQCCWLFYRVYEFSTIRADYDKTWSCCCEVIGGTTGSTAHSTTLSVVALARVRHQAVVVGPLLQQHQQQRLGSLLYTGCSVQRSPVAHPSE